MRADVLRRRDERGLTMVELMITMGLMSVFMAMAGVSLINMSEASKSTNDRSLVNAATRQALEALTRNLRAANPVEVHDPVADYDTQISFEVYCQPAGVGTCQASGVRHFTYRVAASVLEVRINKAFEPDGVTPRFQRILGPEETSASFPLAQRQYAVVNALPSEPVFTYFRRDNVRLETRDPPDGLGAALSTKFRDCSNTVKIRLRVITETGSTGRPTDLATTVNLRNFNRVEGCLAT